MVSLRQENIFRQKKDRRKFVRLSLLAQTYLYWSSECSSFPPLSVIVLLSNLVNVEKKLQGRNFFDGCFPVVSWPSMGGLWTAQRRCVAGHVCTRERIQALTTRYARSQTTTAASLNGTQPHPWLRRPVQPNKRPGLRSLGLTSAPMKCHFELQFLGKHLGVFPVCFPPSISWLTLGKVQPDERMFHSPRQGNRSCLKFGVSHPGNPLARQTWMWGHRDPACVRSALTACLNDLLLK